MLHFLATGEGPERDVVLLDGMKFQAATWQEIGTLHVLAAQEMRALAVDMPGFGLSPECTVEQDTVPEEIAGAKRVIIDGAPHPCYLDHSEMFHKTISDFFSSLS